MAENFEIRHEKDTDGLNYLKLTSTNTKLGLTMEIEPAISEDGINYSQNSLYVRFINTENGKPIDPNEIYEIGSGEIGK